jgi:hypothetical protein
VGERGSEVGEESVTRGAGGFSRVARGGEGRPGV